MLSMEIREIIKKDLEDKIPVKEISRTLRVSQSAIYALKKRIRETGSIQPGYQGRCGRPSSVTAEQLQAMEALVQAQPDCTLEEIRENWVCQVICVNNLSGEQEGCWVGERYRSNL